MKADYQRSIKTKSSIDWRLLFSLRSFAIHVFSYKKLGEGSSSKSLLILVKPSLFLIPNVSYSVSFHFWYKFSFKEWCFYVFLISSFFSNLGSRNQKRYTKVFLTGKELLTRKKKYKYLRKKVSYLKTRQKNVVVKVS